MPFTPATGPRLLIRSSHSEAGAAKALYEAAIAIVQQQGWSGVHWLFPQQHEAELSTGLQIEADDRGEAIVPVSAPYGLRDLWSPSERRWAQGSLAASSRPIRLLGSLRGRGG